MILEKERRKITACIKYKKLVSQAELSPKNVTNFPVGVLMACMAYADALVTLCDKRAVYCVYVLFTLTTNRNSFS